MFYVVGGSNIDIFCKSNKDLILRDSNPCKVSFKFGGVSRNIACNLANQNKEVNFLTAFGNDAFGESLQKDLKARGINIDYSIVSNTHTSSLYLAVIDREDLFMGVNDMAITEEINEKATTPLLNNVKDDDYLVFDTDGENKFIDFLASNPKGIKVVDAISANKVIKLKGIENKIDILKCNLIEAETLSGIVIADDESCLNCVLELLSRGTKEVLVSGKDFLFVGNKDGVTKYTHNLYRDDPVNITGAGDALLSYYVGYKASGYSEYDCAKHALMAAIKTVDSDLTVVEFDMEEEIKNIKVTKEKLK